jgi:F-type H+-transporting ATPase subunit a
LLAGSKKLKSGMQKLGAFILLLIFPLVLKAEEHPKKEDLDVNEMIMHHVKDAHEWHLWGPEHGGTSIYLPVLLLDGDLKVFSSKHFYHGQTKEAKDSKTGLMLHYFVGSGPAKGYALFHEKVYSLKNGDLTFEEGQVVKPLKPLDLSLTKNVVFMLFSCTLLCFIMFKTAAFYKKKKVAAPSGLAKFIEPLVLFVRDDIAKENIHGGKHKKYLPYLLTLFFFILIGNLLGSIPLIGANMTGSATVTFFLACCTLLLTLISSNKNYWKHIFATPGVPVALLPLMIPIEMVGIFTKPVSLMIRLFANITAGHVIILALISIIFINKNVAWAGLSVPMALFISILELLVAFLQAYLFTMLSAMFIGAAVEEHH